MDFEVHSTGTMNSEEERVYWSHFNVSNFHFLSLRDTQFNTLKLNLGKLLCLANIHVNTHSKPSWRDVLPCKTNWHHKQRNLETVNTPCLSLFLSVWLPLSLSANLLLSQSLHLLLSQRPPLSQSLQALCRWCRGHYLRSLCKGSLPAGATGAACDPHPLVKQILLSLQSLQLLLYAGASSLTVHVSVSALTVFDVLSPAGAGIGCCHRSL